MSIPLDRLYEYFACVGNTDTVIYRWLPHGSKKPRDLVSFLPLEGVYTVEDLTHKISVVCHDQEPLDFDFYDEAYLLTEYEFTSGDVKHDHPVNHFFATQHLRVCLHPSHYAPIITHSEVGGLQLSKYTANGFVPCFVWSHALIARDWFRYAEHDPSLAADLEQPCRDFLVYNRSWSGSREYRLKFCELLVSHGLVPSCDIKFNAVDSDTHYTSHRFVNSALQIHRDDLHELLPPNTMQSSASADFTAKDYTQTRMEVVLETVFDSDRIHLTEKILRPISVGRPFIVAAAAGSLEFLRRYGFQTFAPWINESYDLISNSRDRLHAIVNEMQRISRMPLTQKQQMFTEICRVCDHNRRYFFSTAFQDTVLNEFGTNFQQAIAEAKTRNEMSYIDSLAAYHQHNHQAYQPLVDFLSTWHQKSRGIA